ncbi:glycosyltransferase family 8 protein [Streptococcus cameli]
MVVEQQMKYAVAFCVDFQYADKVLTTMKSICAHNRNIRFYILNNDYPQGWFLSVRRKLAALDCEIVDAKVTPIEWEGHTHGHISNAAYSKFLVSDVVEEDVVLYLDSDIIVTGDITHLFSIDFQGNKIAAVNDCDEQTDLWFFGIEDTFNSGVILFNNRLCRQENISQQLMDTFHEVKEKISLGDQSVLNIVFKDSWLNLGVNYNCLLVANLNNTWERRGHNFGKITELPTILHYCSVDKPWSSYCWMQQKELWWYYYDLEWHEIAMGTRPLSVRPKKKYLTLTNSGDIEQLETLAKSLPEHEFHIAAHTKFSPNVVALTKYPNIKIHPVVLDFILEDLMKECDAYLDICYGSEVGGIISKIHALEKPIVAFDFLSKDASGGSTLFARENVADMIDWLKNNC